MLQSSSLKSPSAAAEAKPGRMLRKECMRTLRRAPIWPARKSSRDFWYGEPERAGTNGCQTFLIRRARALLRAHLHDTFVVAGRFNHPTSLFDKQRERLLNINIFASGTRHDGHQRMPMVGSRDDYGIDIFAMQHPAKIIEALSFAATGRNTLFQPRLVGFADGRDIDVGLCHEVEEMPLANQTNSNQAGTQPLVRTQDLPVRR